MEVHVRRILGRLPANPRPLGQRAATAENVNMFPSSMATPPEEHIIHQRRLSRDQISSDLDPDSSVGQETPSRTILPLRMSPRKRLFPTPPETPDTPTKGTRKRIRIARRAKQVSLPACLSGLSKDQLVDLVSRLSINNPTVEDEVRELLPIPDLGPCEEKLKYLQRNIYKSVPNSRYGSSRDTFCYRRVKTHIDAFKKSCVDQGKMLVASQIWDSVVDYCLMAWKYVSGLPVWESPTHNLTREQCFRALASQCSTALKKGVFEKEKYREILKRLERAKTLSSEIQPCINYTTKELDRLL